MEEIFTLLSAWVSLEDLSKLHTVSSSATNTLTDQLDEEIRRVYEIDNWSVMSQEWTNYLFMTDMTPNFTAFLGSSGSTTVSTAFTSQEDDYNMWNPLLDLIANFYITVIWVTLHSVLISPSTSY